jgi:hypothetical protein
LKSCALASEKDEEERLRSREANRLIAGGCIYARACAVVSRRRKAVSGRG